MNLRQARDVTAELGSYLDMLVDPQLVIAVAADPDLAAAAAAAPKGWQDPEILEDLADLVRERIEDEGWPDCGPEARTRDEAAMWWDAADAADDACLDTPDGTIPLPYVGGPADGEIEALAWGEAARLAGSVEEFPIDGTLHRYRLEGSPDGTWREVYIGHRPQPIEEQPFSVTVINGPKDGEVATFLTGRVRDDPAAAERLYPGYRLVRHGDDPDPREGWRLEWTGDDRQD